MSGCSRSGAGALRGAAGAGARRAAGIGVLRGVAVLASLLALPLLPASAAARQGGVAREKRGAPAREARVLVGRVVDAATGGPIPGARVWVEPAAGAGAAADRPVEGVTSNDGAWRLDAVPRGALVLRVEHVAYAPLERRLDAAPADGAPLVLELTPRPVMLDALVVTAGRRLQRLADVPVATELVSSREIEETGATDLASVLTERTGIEVQGGHPAGTGVMIQGLGSERVLVLLDGQPFIGRLSGSIDLSRIPTSMIERIEVVKGPQSTLYGSEAMGGVVNVITRSPAGPTWVTSANLTAGDQGRVDVAGSVVGGVGGWTGLVDFGRRSVELTPGMDAGDGALSRRWDGLVKLGWRTPVDGLRLETSGLLLDERQRWRSGQLYHFADNRQWSGRLGAVWERGRHRISPTFFATAFDHLSRQATSDVPVDGTGERETQRLVEGEVVYALTLGDVSVDAGVETRRESVRSDRVVGGRRETTLLEAYVQTPLTLGSLQLVPGVRYSRSDPWGTHWTPRLAAMYRPTERLALRASAGTGFRAPAFKELYMEFLNIGPGFGYTVRGNPDLEPEVSRNVTAGVEWAGDRTHLRVQAFENRFDDFIETLAVADSAGITIYTYGNVDDGFTRGLEVEAGVTRGGWRLEGGYSLLRAERAETGEPLLGRPRNSARATLGYARPRGLRFSVTGLYTGRTPMSRTEDATAWRDGFLRFDARLAHAIRGGFEIVAGVDNLFDERSEEWPGFTGRHIYVGLSWTGAAKPGDD